MGVKIKSALGSVTLDAENIASNTTVTVPAGGGTLADTGVTDALSTRVNAVGGRKNLIINGGMQVAQRGTSFTAPSATYTLDRWKVWSTNTDGGFDVTQVTDGPSEFKSSLKATITSADTSLGATQFAIIRYPFEGQDIVGTASGTADAKTMTLSFWVKCSVTGTFGGALADGAFSYSFPFSYTVLAANTWEKKTVTITGATSGNFSNDITQGMQINFSMGSGSTYSGTANTWGSAGYFDATGTDAVIATNGATWQVTGVQLELGDTATDFEHRSYGEELALCQRYYIGSAYAGSFQGSTNENGGTSCIFAVPDSRYKSMRDLPTLSLNNTGSVIHRSGVSFYTATSFSSSGLDYITVNASSSLPASINVQMITNRLIADAEL